jgi:hypothetical protein
LLLLGCGSEPVAAAAPAAPSPASIATQPAGPDTAPSATAVSSAPIAANDSGSDTPTRLLPKPVDLPGAIAPASLDYIAYEPQRRRVWVPVGGTGSVDVFDIARGAFTRVDGFKTAEREVRGAKRTIGPSAVAIGEGFAYIGNRATSEICAVNESTLAPGRCLVLTSPPDGLAYVRSAKEVWVTAPRTHEIAVLDASRADGLSLKTVIRLGGAPEGYASDESRGLFFTNLEDKNQTVVVDVAAHQPKATWDLDCASDGPRGIAADAIRRLVFVACTDHLLVLDAARGGSQVATFEVGAGVDNIGWLEAKRWLFVAAAKAGTLTVLRIDDAGHPSVVARGVSAQGARNGVADDVGNAYVPDPVHARLLVFPFLP